MLAEIKEIIYTSEPFIKLLEQVGSGKLDQPVYVQGISGSLMAFVTAYLFEQKNQQMLIIVPDKDRAEQLRDDCALLLGDSSLHLYVAGPSHAAKLLDMSAPIAQIETLQALSRSEKFLIIASAEALTLKLPSLNNFVERTLTLESNTTYPFEKLVQQLLSLGFEKKDFVEEYGDFAVRGGILDIFPFVGENPIRFEFWGDTIESIREFDVLSQRSIRELQTANIVASLHQSNTDLSTERPELNSSDIKLQQQTSFIDYLAANATIFLDEPSLLEREINELFREGYSDILDWKSLHSSLGKFSQIIHTSLGTVPIQNHSFIHFHSHPQPPLAGSIKRLVEHLNKLKSERYSLWLSCDTEEEAIRLNELIEEELTAPTLNVRGGENEDEDHESIKHNQQGEIENTDSIFRNQTNENSDRLVRPSSDFSSPPSYQLLKEAIHSGFIYTPAQVAVFAEHEIFGRLKRRGTAKRRKFKGFSQKELQQLKRGDFVVHQDFGIGRFAGLQKIKVRGVETEVMKLVYEENDLLYVHLNYVNRVQKYSSQEGHTPKLHKLGGPDWERLKSRARKKIKDIARDLIKLYARRKHEQGFAFASDTHWQREMEASFIYEDTPDQAKSTLDVKKDMEQSSPMDRLICGDVGFGKTEVAVRASFKAVMNNKQVAVLVPTTILAQQHFNTFLDRVGRYSIRVEALTRFRARKEQVEVIDALKAGKVDVLIGTHRLLSKDVAFKDLGLLIIDEEQRFGVSAKEKLRQLRASVDTLTLTATPIPRTLQFSLMGARDLSLINTPPRNRIPIQTEIAQFDEQLIREAIMKELHRGGQVYFVHDRVQNIDHIQSMLEGYVPNARFHVAHGQMKGHELEKAMMDFLEKKFDVLICTKIIESGIDIPSVNTIIINRADKFGLAELYQLRGRVGRSNIQAFAYLLTPPLSVLPRATLRRLQAIQEFTELGCGFNLAMRDLEIRGAGNLLGGEQSGFILEMGFEMYQRVVEEAVVELKEEEFQEIVEQKTEFKSKKGEAIIETDVEALIPDIYIEQDSERLDIYRRLYRCESKEEIDMMRKELNDRFGEYPEEVEHLFCLVELKEMAATLGFIKLELSEDQLSLHFPLPEITDFYEGDGAPFQKIVGRIQALKSYHPHLKQEGKQLKLMARITRSESPFERLDAIANFLKILNPCVRKNEN